MAVQYLRQVNLTFDRMNYLHKGVNVMDFLLKFLQSSRALCRYQINLVKNYNVLKQAAKLLALPFVKLSLRENIIALILWYPMLNMIHVISINKGMVSFTYNNYLVWLVK